ncbi:MAG TPA: hypothetical protein DEH27_01765 [Deltaproteobacteria bacterium]|nr:hypothetical protein [Deltaproteobacteria bacterium]
MRTLIASVVCMVVFCGVAGAAGDIRKEEVHFKKGESGTTITGKIKGRQTVDYPLRARAGQTMAVTFKPRSLSAYFNVLPPGSNDVASFVGSTSGNHFTNVLATDGVYTIRVYLMRSAARRNETSDYALTISIEGKALEPIPASTDATLPGTPFHASANVTCVPIYESKVQACEAFVIRRGFDGTATVEIRPASGLKRSILFVGGKPVASDSQNPITSTRKDDLTIVTFDYEERYEIPDALITGG